MMGRIVCATAVFAYCVCGVAFADETPATLAIPVHPREMSGTEGALMLHLRAVLERAGRENLGLRIAESRAEAAEGERKSAADRWWPSLGAGVLSRHTDGTLQGTFGDIGTSTFDTALATAILRWDLNPMATRQRSRAAAGESRAARASVEATRSDAQLEAAGEYMELLGAAALATVARKTQDDAANFLKMTRALEEQGLGPEVDVQRARSELAVRQQSLAVAEKAFRVASARLAETLDMDPSAIIIPADEAIKAPVIPGVEGVETSLARALADRPEVKEAAEQVTSARARLASLRWDAYGPGITLEAQRGLLGTSFPEAREQTIYGARLGWTFSPFQIGAVRAAQSRLTAGRLEEERTKQRIRAEVVAAREEVELARRRLDPTREALEAAEKSLGISRVRFTGGIGSTLEVLQAQDAVAATRAEAVQVLVEAHQAIYQLRRALGASLAASDVDPLRE